MIKKIASPGVSPTPGRGDDEAGRAAARLPAKE